MTFEEMARANGWEITLNSRDQYIADDNDHRAAHTMPDGDPYVLDADTEEEAWAELCELEGITEAGFGHAERQQKDGWIEV